MHLAIRADGGPDIGYGHLVRSSALAEVILDDSASVTVATTTPEHANDVFPEAVSVVQIPARNDPAPFRKWLVDSDIDVVFTDAYPIDTEYQRIIREVVPLVVLQDDARHAVCADIFVNGNLYATELDYEFDGDTSECHLGPEYALLRSEVRELAANEPFRRDTVERAIVTMGGSDQTNVTPATMRAFDGFDISVDAIVGPGYKTKQETEIRDVAANISADVRVTRDPEDLPERMFQADFGICTASTTTYELLALGTPFVAVPVVDNQQLIAQTLRSNSIATVLNQDNIVESLPPVIRHFMQDASLLRKQRSRGRELVDGWGADRIAEIITGLVSD